MEQKLLGVSLTLFSTLKKVYYGVNVSVFFQIFVIVFKKLLAALAR